MKMTIEIDLPDNFTEAYRWYAASHETGETAIRIRAQNAALGYIARVTKLYTWWKERRDAESTAS
jgi:hypothetical protein